MAELYLEIGLTLRSGNRNDLHIRGVQVSRAGGISINTYTDMVDNRSRAKNEDGQVD